MAIPHPATRVHLLTLTALCPSLVSGERGTGAAQKGNSYTLELFEAIKAAAVPGGGVAYSVGVRALQALEQDGAFLRPSPPPAVPKRRGTATPSPSAPAPAPRRRGKGATR